MRNLGAVLLVSLLPSLALAATPEQEVLAVEARRISAFVQGDTAALTSVLADDLTYTHTNGQVETREQLLASLTSGRIDYEDIKPSDMQVRIYGNTAVVTGRADMKVKAQGNPLAFAIRFTALWVRGDGSWRMVAWQSTRLP